MLLLAPVVIAAVLGVVALIIVAVAVVSAVWGVVRLLLWLDEVKRRRRRPEPPDVSQRIAELEHELLDGPLGHDGCRWCVMERAYATTHGTSHYGLPRTASSASLLVRQM